MFVISIQLASEHSAYSEKLIKRVNWWHLSKLTNINPLMFFVQRKGKSKKQNAHFTE